MAIEDMSKKLNLTLEFVIFLFTTAVLVIANYWPHPRDAGAYVNGGIRIISGVDPYSDEVFRGGPFGATVLAVVFGNLLPEFQTIIFLLLSVLGTWAFSRVFLSNGFLGIISCFIVQVSSSNRTSMDTIQLTGVILGAVALLLWINSKKNSIARFPMMIAAVSLFAVLNDSKPHIIAPLLLLLGFKLRMQGFLLAVLICQLLGNMIVGLLFGFSHFTNWVKLILRIGESQDYEKFDGAAHNYWQIVTFLLPDLPGWFGLVPFLLYFLIICIGLYHINQLSVMGSVAVACIAISVTSYSHFYDMVPIVVLIIYAFSKVRADWVTTAITLFILAPQNWNSLFNLSFILGVTILFCLLTPGREWDSKLNNIERNLWHILSQSCLGILFYGLIQIFNSFILTERKLIDALTTSELLVMFILLLFHRKSLILLEKVSKN